MVLTPESVSTPSIPDTAEGSPAEACSTRVDVSLVFLVDVTLPPPGGTWLTPKGQSARTWGHRGPQDEAAQSQPTPP